MARNSHPSGEGPARAPRNQEWLLALLPAFPIVLLVMRLWYAVRQDTQTLLLLVQYVSPLGMFSVVLLTTVWTVPVVVLVGRALGSLYRVSTGRSSWLVRGAHRIPDWVVAIAVVAAMVGWPLRFLPALLMLTLTVWGLTAYDRHGGKDRRTLTACVIVPVTVIPLCYTLLWPAITLAWAEREVATLVMLAVPPVITPLLTGPVPTMWARFIAYGGALALAVLLPVAAGAVVLRAPVLPLTALEVADEPDGEVVKEVVVGYLIAGDDRMSTVLERNGPVRFIRNDMLISKVLCPEPGDVPHSRVHLHRWHVEKSMLSWLVPGRPPAPRDPRCEGRPDGRTVPEPSAVPSPAPSPTASFAPSPDRPSPAAMPPLTAAAVPSSAAG